MTAYGTAIELAGGGTGTVDAAQRAAVNPWWGLGLSIRTLVCRTCDVSWSEQDVDTCWMCGEPGTRMRDT